MGRKNRVKRNCDEVQLNRKEGQKNSNNSEKFVKTNLFYYAPTGSLIIQWGRNY